MEWGSSTKQKANKSVKRYKNIVPQKHVENSVDNENIKLKNFGDGQNRQIDNEINYTPEHKVLQPCY